MKKLILTALLASSVLMADKNTTPDDNMKVIDHPVIVKTLIMPIVGFVLLPTLVLGDAQWQVLTNKGKCDSDHTIYTISPTPANIIDIGVPCSEWFDLNRK